MTATMRNGGRPLPQPPGAFMDQEAAWYEHEERMRPSYIVSPAQQQHQQQQQQQQQQQRYYGPPPVASQPPLSPSSRWAGAGAQVGSPYNGLSSGPQYPFPAQPQQGQPQQRYAYPSDVRSSSAAALSSSGRGSSSGTRPVSPVSTRATTMSLQTSGGEADPSMRTRPLHLNSTPSRFQSSPVAAEGGGGRAMYQPFSLENEEARRTGVAKGSAFMHKGFFDILSLVNNQGSRPPNAAATGFKATFSKATGRFRKDSNTGNGRTGIMMGKQDDPFFSTPAPPLQQVRRAPLQQTTSSNRAAVVSMPPSMAAFGNAPATFAAHQHPQFAGAALGPKAAKKRISVDMVGAPHVDSFVHAAHASDAEQAEEILRRWGRDNVGKIADPAWINRCKEAMRVQQARNQAEAIAQIQAALHEESAFKDNPRQLHIVNGTPSNLTTATTITPGTIGHGSLSGDSLAAQRPQPNAAGYFEQIAEEGGNPVPAQNGIPRTPRRVTPGGAQSPPPVALTRPPMIPRTNTQGTMLVNSPTSPAAARNNEVPDYLQFQPQNHANKLPEEVGNQRSSKVIDGMPEGFATGAGAIDALFERPISMVVRDSLQPTAPAPAPHRTLAGQELPMTLADHAGAALRPSLTTVEKSVAAKIYFENLYYGILKKPQARETRRAGLEAELALLRLPESSKEAIRNAWVANETGYLRDIRARVNVNSFTRLKTIGHGAFGVVSLCQERGTGELFAMKQLRKADMLRKGQEGHVRAERDLMTSASASANAKWIVKLVYSFQDVDHLYLIMEFMGGGDLLNLLIEKDIFAEDFARFYVAEMILAVHEAHRLGYIHRDIKPDNFLFTSQGHVKLADFGLCQSFHWAHDGAYYDQQRKNMLKKHGIDLEDSGAAARTHASRSNAMGGNATGRKGNGDGKLTEKELNDVMSDRNEDGTPLTHVLTWRERNKKKIAYSVVGTNNYMAPEVLRGLGYDQSCDWWSLGVIVFEMLYGYPPFVSKSRHLTRQKILNWRQTLRFPPKPRISREAQDFIGRLICERDDRLGSQALASVSRPNSLLQGSRQPSGFVAGAGADGKIAGAGLTDGVEELMSHPWFRGIDWNTIHTQKAPFVPALSHPADTKHFEDDIEDAPLPAPGAAEAAKNGQPIPVEQPRDPMLRDKAHGQHLLEMRKQLAFVGYTFKSPKSFDPKAQLTESKIVAAERAAAGEGARLSRSPSQFASTGSRLRSMSM